MRLNKTLQKDYTLSSPYYQIKLPLDLEILISTDDPVRLLSAFVEGMELRNLYKTYGKVKKNQTSPKQLFKIIIYARKPAPDHATIAQFISLHFSQCSKETMAEVIGILYELGEISGKSLL